MSCRAGPASEADSAQLRKRTRPSFGSGLGPARYGPALHAFTLQNKLCCDVQCRASPLYRVSVNTVINCLELLAATLALKAFVKNQHHLTALLKLDNTTAVAYINNQGGTVSKDLVSLTRDLWMWCLERNIHIEAQHLPGVLNCVADSESRHMKDQSDWKLDQETFMKINQRFGPLEVDMFASRLTNQCPHYFSWRPDPFAEATDAFLHCQDPQEGEGSGSTSGSNNTSVEGTTLVRQPPSHVSGSAVPPTPAEGRPLLRHNPPISRMEYLRKDFSSRDLSNQATELVLESWRS